MEMRTARLMPLQTFADVQLPQRPLHVDAHQHLGALKSRARVLQRHA